MRYSLNFCDDFAWFRSQLLFFLQHCYMTGLPENSFVFFLRNEAGGLSAARDATNAFIFWNHEYLQSRKLLQTQIAASILNR